MKPARTSHHISVTAPVAASFYFATDGRGGKTTTRVGGPLNGATYAALDSILITKVDSAGAAQTLGICLDATTDTPSVTHTIPIPKTLVCPYPVPLGGIRGLESGDGTPGHANIAFQPSHANVEFLATMRDTSGDDR